MFVNIKVQNKNRLGRVASLMVQTESNAPLYFTKQFKRNVVPLTPRKTSYLRRSIVSQVIRNRARIGWRAPYAQEQEQGYTVPSKPYRKYTTPGTGPHFAERAMEQTKKDMDVFLDDLARSIEGVI